MTDATNEQPESFDLNSDDVAVRKKAALRQLFPEAFNEDEIDFDQLKRALGDWIDEGTERFGLTWPGKAACMKVIQAPATGALRPDRDESVNFDGSDHVFIEGDNLEVLKLLQKAYFGKVKMVYIDPPYNTGKEFIYPDKYAENLDTYLSYTSQSDDEGKKFSTNTESSGRFHSRWLNMMYPRIFLARNLLREDGLFFVSIDENEMTNVKMVCDSIFGSNNFVNTLVWKKRYNAAKEKNLAAIHEYVLIYSKNVERLNDFFVPGDAEYFENLFKEEDEFVKERGKFMTQPLEAGNSMDARPNLRYPLSAPNGEEVWPRRQWVWAREKAVKAASQGRLKFYKNSAGEWKVRHKQYELSENGEKRKVKPFSIYDKCFTQDGTKEIETLFGDSSIFPFPKPTKLLKHLVDLDGSESGIFLDFFAGSNSFGHALFLANSDGLGARKLISVQLPEHIDEDSVAAKAGFDTISSLSRERLRRSGTMLQSQGLDTGFRAFKLCSSAFSKWSAASDQGANDLLSMIDDHASHISEVDDEDVLFELLLKDGFELTIKIDSVPLPSSKVYSIADGALLICLERNLTKEIIDALADVAEGKDAARIVCLDAGFQGNDELKTNAVQTFKSRLGHGEDGSMFRTV